MENIILGGGCFWCLEAVFQRLKGVESVQSGYAGGHVKNPAYREVCNGTTGHAEVIKIEYNPEEISLDTLLKIFFTTHDPTTLNRQGNDVGTQYRSVIYFKNEDEQKVIAKFIENVAKDYWTNPIVTEVEIEPTFYPAEEYHDDYYNQNNSNPYCFVVINPKINKIKSEYADLLKV